MSDYWFCEFAGTTDSPPETPTVEEDAEIAALNELPDPNPAPPAEPSPTKKAAPSSPTSPRKKPHEETEEIKRCKEAMRRQLKDPEIFFGPSGMGKHTHELIQKALPGKSADRDTARHGCLGVISIVVPIAAIVLFFQCFSVIITLRSDAYDIAPRMLGGSPYLQRMQADKQWQGPGSEPFWWYLSLLNISKPGMARYAGPLRSPATDAAHCDDMTMQAVGNHMLKSRATFALPQCDMINYGNYVPGCESGFYGLGVDPLPCPPGFMCLEGLTCIIACPHGSLCPVSSIDPSNDEQCYYPHGNKLPKVRTATDGSKLCPGAYALRMCPAGSFCPSGNVTRSCPKGHKCPKGTFDPVECTSFENCDEGGLAESDTSLVIILLVCACFVTLILTSEGPKIWREQMKLIRLLKKHQTAVKDGARNMAGNVHKSFIERRSSTSRAEQAEGGSVNVGDMLAHLEHMTVGKAKTHGLGCASAAANWVRSFDPLEDSIYDRNLDSLVRPNSAFTPKGMLVTLGFSAPASLLCYLIASFVEGYAHQISYIIFGILLLIALFSTLKLASFAQNLQVEQLCCGLPRRAHALLTAASLAVLVVCVLVVLTRAATRHGNHAMWSLGSFCVAVAFLGGSALSCFACAERPEEFGEDLSKLSTVCAGAHEANDQDYGFSIMHEPLDLKMKVEFKQLGLALHSNGLQVLESVTGVTKPKKITAIMGPSGAGKTTFMNTLAGRASYGKTTGKIFINDKEGTVRSYSARTGFVPQDDIMLRDLTVRQQFAFYAKLRLPPETTDKQIGLLVEEMLDCLGLTRVAHSIIGDEVKRGISGGQRKRVNVGMEMVSRPSLLFLDEPTSGLDSTTSYALLEALRVCADTGCNIMTVLHQPSFPLYQLFDNVLLLGVGGRTVYLGPATKTAIGQPGALEWFTKLDYRLPENHNPADFFMDVIAGKVEHPEGKHKDKEFLFEAWAEQCEMMAKKTILKLFRTRLLVKVKKIRDRKAKEAAADESKQEKTSETGSPSRPKMRGLTKQASFVITNSEVAHEINEEFFELAGAQNRDNKRAFLSAPRTFLVFFDRCFVQELRNVNELIFGFISQMALGGVFGALFAEYEFNKLTTVNFLITLGIGFTMGLGSLKCFGGERVVFWREAAPGSGMALSKGAYFLAKNLIELPKLAALTFFVVLPFHSIAKPAYSLQVAFFLCACSSICISGFGYFFSIVMDPKGAQLTMVVANMVFILFSGFSPTLRAIDLMGPGPQALAWLSYARWLNEGLFTAETLELSDAWKMPVGFYDRPTQDSAIFQMLNMRYQESYTRGPDDVTGGKPVYVLNALMMLCIGIGMRILSFVAMCVCNRSKMGLPSFSQVILGNMSAGGLRPSMLR